jgi:hypothetical protein
MINLLENPFINIYNFKIHLKYMEFYIVFVKNRKKLDKYIKVNRVRNKTIIDIKQQLEDHGLEDVSEWREYFNLIIYTKIAQTLRKKRDVYYIPNISKLNVLDIDDIFQIKENIDKINFNLLFFFEDFKDNQQLYENLLSNISLFDAIQIIRDY